MSYERVFAQHVLVTERLAVVVLEVERAAHFGLPNALCLLSDSLSCHALFLVCEVGPQSSTCCDEEDSCCEIEWLHSISFERAPNCLHLVHGSLDIKTYPALVSGPDLIYCFELAPRCRL
jgi:hypothetical protein